MGHMFWVSSCVAFLCAAIGFGAISIIQADKDPREQQYETAYAEPAIGTAARLSISNSGSAISAAAFGLEALQPATYDGEIVLDIINASPLASRQKLELAAELRAAETGRADLGRVLSDVRVALAIE